MRLGVRSCRNARYGELSSNPAARSTLAKHDEQVGDAMGLLEKLVIGGGAVLGVAWVRNAREESRRKACFPEFIDGISQDDFIAFAEDAARRTPRVSRVLVHDMRVALTVTSNSGLTTWTADVDFNDYGRLTGRYWISTENSDSLIPQHFAEILQGVVSQRRR